MSRLDEPGEPVYRHCQNCGFEQWAGYSTCQKCGAAISGRAQIIDQHAGRLGRKSSHRKEVDATSRIVANLFEKTTEGGADAPLVLRFAMPDSGFRYFVFCLSTVQMACARHMNNPDAVLNELLHTLVTGTIGTDLKLFFGGPVDPQRVANRAGEHLQDYLDRWSAYLNIAGGGNSGAATAIVCGMIRSTESLDPPTETDARRLWPLATWIEQRLEAMAGAFVDMAQ